MVSSTYYILAIQLNSVLPLKRVLPLQFFPPDAEPKLLQETVSEKCS